MKQLITTYYLGDSPDTLYHDEEGIYPHVLHETIEFWGDTRHFKVIEIAAIIGEKRIERRVFLQEIIE